MLKSKLVTILAVIALVGAMSVSADVPNRMNYQGVLTDHLGNPIDTTISITFTIYDSETGGNTLWS